MYLLYICTIYLYLNNDYMNEKNIFSRDVKGYWKPVDKIEYQPVFRWPVNFIKIFIALKLTKN